MSSEEVISRLKSQANRLPNKPGVYIMSNDITAFRSAN